MASFVRSVLRLFNSGRRPTKGPDEEQATTTAESVFGSSTLPPSHIHVAGNRIPADDALALFRLTLGITSAPHLGFSLSAHRPADNVGLYARVVRNEQTAKDSYKVFSLVINACYFLQIIVAASLTAMGAASANNRAITAFGAMNTVIAGFLTYLKGSGYPARFKYCANEWKKVREFVEHRERDFSLESCTLDVHEEIDAVREMYETTKHDVEMNNPEAYNAKSSSPKTRYDGVDKSKADAIAGKLRGLDDTVRKLTGHASSAAGGAEEKSGEMALKLRSLEDTLEKMTKQAGKTAEESRDAAHNAVHSAVGQAVDDVEKRAMTEIRGLGKAAIRGVEDHRPRAPREVSISMAPRDGDDPGNQIEVAGKK
ncbi:uncharacterized protein B0H64DRAFT_375647 [Chaetomium fimeti]|uniref:SMODS and SLOG-associating 2TM effector domain-containing protein n=1 Tax=Chaetomium fimeti TaxID=1854472 RepID=A0AAE0HEH7_9PEZI|nr:hypothetical protein B0H64DRAFT_375647 [Chaetomium fimeti]